MPNLYTGDLSKVSGEDVRRFLCLDSANLNERPKEDVRFDFKLDLPQKLGETVAAFSNTYGGLILLGVASVPKQKDIPDSMVGTTLCDDPKSLITDKILATVHPRPNFEVHVMLTSSPGKHVAIIRVHIGTFPPYEFAQGSTIKIPIRVQNTNRQATVMGMEELLRRRHEQEVPELNEVERLYLTPLAGSISIPWFERPSQRVADVNRFGMVLIPTIRVDLGLDLTAEKRLEALLWSAFRGDTQFARAAGGTRWQGAWQRFGTQSDYEFRIDDEKAPCDRIWRFWSGGALGFVTNHSRTKVPEPVGNLLSDSLRFCRLATNLLEGSGYFGDFVFAQNLQCPSRKFEASFLPPGGFGTYDRVDWINFPEDIAQGRGTASTYLQRTQWDSVREPVELVTSAMVYHLREIANASVDSEKLRQQTSSLHQSLKLSVWESQ